MAESLLVRPPIEGWSSAHLHLVHANRLFNNFSFAASVNVLFCIFYPHFVEVSQLVMLIFLGSLSLALPAPQVIPINYRVGLPVLTITV